MILPLLLLTALTVAASSPPETEDCSTARMKCAYRVGCGMALQEYMLRCADVMTGRTKTCSLPCKRALIALTSTEEGKSLMQCRCGDDFCRLSKQRVEVCRPEVSRAVAEGTVVSCAVAQWICTADHLCSTALVYYNRFCGAMFHGRKCTPRCNNSVAILNRQEKAAKLRDCYCDGSENFPCKRIKTNMDRLCFGRDESSVTSRPATTTDLDNELSPLNNNIDEEEARKHKRRASASASARTFWHWWLTALLVTLVFRT